MTNNQNQKHPTDWIEDYEPDWGYEIMCSIDERKPFATETGYCRLLSFLTSVESDLLAFENLEKARQLLPPLMSNKMFPLLKADLLSFDVEIVSYRKIANNLQNWDERVVAGWLLVVEQLLFSTKSTYNSHYWAKHAFHGHATWCKYSEQDFDTAMMNAFGLYYDGEWTKEQVMFLDIGRAAAVSRLYTMGELML